MRKGLPHSCPQVGTRGEQAVVGDKSGKGDLEHIVCGTFSSSDSLSVLTAYLLRYLKDLRQKFEVCPLCARKTLWKRR